MIGKIYKILSNFNYVKVDDRIVECKAQGKVKREIEKLLVGDNVQVELIDNNKGNIIGVEKRKNKLLRPNVANLDKLIITVSMKSPDPDYILLDKQIIYCLFNNIIPIICLTKIDLIDKNEYLRIKSIYEKIGYKVYCISSIENIGIDSLKNELKNCVCVFSGNSGVGKSTLINNIIGKDIMDSGVISSKNQRGKHTTRHVQIIENDEMLLVDTPGFSLFECNIPYKDVELYYEEFNDYINNCEFKDCLHIKEEKCAVKNAVKNGFISKDRYERYITIVNSMRI